MTATESGDCTGTAEHRTAVPVSSRKHPAGQTLHLILILVVLLLAFFLRIHRLPSVPFGWHPDEATKGLLARDVLDGKYYPVFFSAFTGRESLYVYLEAAFFALFGEGIFAGRLLSAFIGVLTIAATYAVGRELFNRRVGLLASALLAASLWHLIASRNGYRAVLQSLVQLPALWFLFRGWRAAKEQPSQRPPHWQFAAAGLFLGLTQYTYTAARFFPVLVVAIVLFAWISMPSLVKRRWLSLAAMFLVALIVFVPLGIHFYRHPIDFYGRAAQISVLNPRWGSPGERLWQSVKETARMFMQWGDPNFRFNLAGEPVFGPVDGAFFYVGLLLSLWFAVRKRGLRRLAFVALPLWLGVMLLPMTLSAEGLPYYQRAIGTLPAVYFFPALALDTLVSWILIAGHFFRGDRFPVSNIGESHSEPVEERLPRPFDALKMIVGLDNKGESGSEFWIERHTFVTVAIRVGCVLCLVLLTAWLTVRVYRDYFVAWHTAPRNDDDRNVAMVYVANYLRRHEPQGELYVSSRYEQHPTLAFLAPEHYDGIHWFDARQSLPLPPRGVEATYVMTTKAPPHPILMGRAKGLRQTHTGLDRFDRPVFEVYRWESEEYPMPSEQSPVFWSWEVTFEPDASEEARHPMELPVDFGNTMMFLGYNRSADAVRSEETLELVLYWRLLKRPERHYSIFAHLLDAQSNIVGEYDANRYATSFWLEGGGERLLSYFPLKVKPGTPPGEYQLEIGVYHQPSGERMPIYEKGEMVADRLLLRPVTVR